MYLDSFLKNKKVVVFDSTLKHLIGLMFHKKTKNVYLFKFKKEERLEIHTFFMLHSINIYFFDKNKKLIDEKFMKPWKIYTPKKKFKYIVEIFK